MRGFLLVFSLLICLPASAQELRAPADPGIIPYQGVLLDDGTPVTTTQAMTFWLYASPSGGQPVWTSTRDVTPEADGRFSVALGTSTPFPEDLFKEALWLQVRVGSTVLNPRTQLGSSPYATGLSRPLNMERSVEVGGLVSVRNTQPTGNTSGVSGSTVSPDGTGVFGGAVASTGASVGVEGQTISPDGRGVRGLATATTGSSRGGYFTARSGDGRGVFGENTATSGAGVGMYGLSRSGAGTGVLGNTTATSGVTYGGGFFSSSPDGFGVRGRNNSTSGEGIGVIGESQSNRGTGVLGRANGTNGTTYGVRGEIASSQGAGVMGLSGSSFAAGVEGRNDSGAGVLGKATNTSSGAAVGVKGETVSSSGMGVWAVALAETGSSTAMLAQNFSSGGTAVSGVSAATTGSTTGMRGEIRAPSGTAVQGVSTAQTGSTNGVSGQISSPGGRAVSGAALAATGTTYGGDFSSASSSGYALRARATANSGTTHGLRVETNSIDGYSGYFDGGRGVTILNNSGINPSRASLILINAADTGDLIRAISVNNRVFRVDGDGRVFADGGYQTGGADFAEFFPLAPASSGGAASGVAPGRVVGLSGGHVSLNTDGAEQVMVVSSDPAFIGNEGAQEGGALVALVGQVEVPVTGTASPGDVLVASGLSDGMAQPLAPEAYDPARDGAVIGRVLSVDEGRVVALVGVDEAAALRAVVARQSGQIDALKVQVRALLAESDQSEAAADALARRLDALDAQISTLLSTSTAAASH